MIFIGELFKIEDRPFPLRVPPGRVSAAKMMPKLSQNAFKIVYKNVSKKVMKKNTKRDTKMEPKWEPKWTQNVTKK